MESISKRREKEERLKKLIDTGDVLEYVKSILEYCIPWLALFVITLVLA